MIKLLTGWLTSLKKIMASIYTMTRWQCMPPEKRQAEKAKHELSGVMKSTDINIPYITATQGWSPAS